MEGYDTTLLGSFFGYPSFRQKYGTYIDQANGYQLSSQWQTGLNDIGAVGNIIGALLNGYFTPKYGHRKVMMINLVAMAAFIFIVFFAPNLPCLLVGEFLCSVSTCSGASRLLEHLLTLRWIDTLVSQSCYHRIRIIIS